MVCDTQQQQALPSMTQLHSWLGSRNCFKVAVDYLSGFGVPYTLVLGNHDLEGDEFEEDADNLAAWQEAFGQQHYWSAELGPALVVGLSTVRFRSNRFR